MWGTRGEDGSDSEGGEGSDSEGGVGSISAGGEGENDVWCELACAGSPLDVK
jgi:hypothetical protein